MSGIDATTMWATIVIAIGTSLAAVVAWFQVNKLAALERSRVTIEYIKAFDTVSKQIPDGQPQTAAVSMANMHELLSDQNELRAYREFAAAFYDKRNVGKEPPSPAVFQKFKGSVAAGLNYFIWAASLAARNQLDVKTFASFFKPQVRFVEIVVERLADVDPHIAELRDDPEMKLLWEAGRNGKGLEFDELSWRL
jgi:hypothetical protein